MFLNGCSTQRQAEQLLAAGVSVVIATSQSIDDDVATEFAVRFYEGLAQGATIQIAYREAAAELRSTREIIATYRGVYVGEQADGKQVEPDRWPWDLYLRKGSEIAEQWSLPEVADDPLFGLPELPDQDLPEKLFRNLDWFSPDGKTVLTGCRDKKARLDVGPRFLLICTTSPRVSAVLAGAKSSSIDHPNCIIRRGGSGEIERNIR